MNNIAAWPITKQQAIFQATAQKQHLTTAIVEKDFWVCFLLNIIFHESRYKDLFIFKGGTSLSKGFGIIFRFSEDIDLVLDWTILGMSDAMVFVERTRSQQEKLNQIIQKKTAEWIKHRLVPEIETRVADHRLSPSCISVAPSDPNTLIFKYPSSFTDASILPVIRLEIGALASRSPTDRVPITSLVAEAYPQLFTMAYGTVIAINPIRTFWEKITIVHREAMRPKERPMPLRYSRHYYDLYCLLRYDAKHRFLSDLSFIGDVVRFKQRFYACSWAHYENILCGKLRLIPPSERWPELSRDYRAMSAMIYEIVPSLETIFAALMAFETQYNQLAMVLL